MVDTLTLASLAEQIGARFHGDDAPFRGVGTDSRTLRSGELFIALRGPSFDGHDFIGQVLSKGAGAVMVDRQMQLPLPMLEVDDTRKGLGRLAAVWRSRFPIPLVAVTGSNGKTTVKEMLASILARRGAVLATRGNLNNDIGVPLTLLRLGEHHRAAVVELGANHPGEIAWLTGLVRPDVAVITNAGAAHLEGFGSLEGVARAKGEILEGLGSAGWAVINADDSYASLWRKMNRTRSVMSFGLERPSDVSGEWSGGSGATGLLLKTPLGDCELELPLAGRHNVMNALAATAAALAMGIELDAVRAGLEGIEPVPGRMQRKRGIAGVQLIDDSYNANPDSLGAALKVLAEAPGTRCLVLGDMGELGSEAFRLHSRIGELARSEGVDRLYATGELSSAAVAAFGEGGYHFSSREQLIATLRRELAGEMTVLIKGSRSMQMEKVVVALSETGDGC